MPSFDSLLKTYNDPNASEFDKGKALGAMNEKENQRMQWNKEHNPEKYHADSAKKAKARADGHEKQNKKR